MKHMMSYFQKYAYTVTVIDAMISMMVLSYECMYFMQVMNIRMYICMNTCNYVHVRQ